MGDDHGLTRITPIFQAMPRHTEPAIAGIEMEMSIPMARLL